MRPRKKQLMNRRYVILNIITIMIGGVLFGIAIHACFAQARIASFQNLSICMILFTLLCLFCWLPLTVPSDQIMEIGEETISLMPKYTTRKKLGIVWYTLINNTAKPFYRVVPLKDINQIVFTYEDKWGSYAYHRFTFLLRFKIGDESLVIYLNPGQNGPLMPSGNGLPFAGIMSKAEMVNLVEYFRANGVDVHDPYRLVNAMKDENVVLYDYLVSLKKDIKF